MLVKLAIKNFFKRFHTFLICFGFFLLSIVIAALIFIGGMQLVLSIQPGDLLPEIQNYFLYDFKINGVNEILDLSIFERVYNDILLIDYAIHNAYPDLSEKISEIIEACPNYIDENINLDVIKRFEEKVNCFINFIGNYDKKNKLTKCTATYRPIFTSMF